MVQVWLFPISLLGFGAHPVVPRPYSCPCTQGSLLARLRGPSGCEASALPFCAVAGDHPRLFHPLLSFRACCSVVPGAVPVAGAQYVPDFYVALAPVRAPLGSLEGTVVLSQCSPPLVLLGSGAQAPFLFFPRRGVCWGTLSPLVVLTHLPEVSLDTACRPGMAARTVLGACGRTGT